MTKPRFNEEKFRELILYIAKKSERDPRFGATKLNKILFYSDFAAYRGLGRPITGADYQNIEEGPAPRQLLPLRKKYLGKEWEVKPAAYFDRQQERIVAKRHAIQSFFTRAELRIVDRVIKELWDLNATEVSERSHKELGYKLTNRKESVPYSSAWFSPEPLTPIEINLGQQVARRHVPPER